MAQSIRTHHRVNCSIYLELALIFTHCQALAQLGIRTEVSGQENLTIKGKKFSGNAMSLDKNRLLFHGTLLFDSDLEVLGQALNVSSDNIESKGIKSVRSRVTHIEPYIATRMQIVELKQTLKQLIPRKKY